MKLQLLSINVRGLIEDSVVSHLRSYLQDCTTPLDIVTVQEHKVQGAKLLQAPVKLWRHTLHFGLDASVGYGHNRSTRAQGAMTFSP